jgi:hypothetical protein
VLLSIKEHLPNLVSVQRSFPAESETHVPNSSAANAMQPLPDPAPASSVYVHLMSGEVATISPATNVVVLPDMVIVYNGELAVASYPRREVFSCSMQETSPSFT